MSPGISILTWLPVGLTYGRGLTTGNPEFLAEAYIQILPARPTRELVNRPDARHLYLNAFSDRVATRPLDSYHISGAYVGIR